MFLAASRVALCGELESSKRKGSDCSPPTENYMYSCDRHPRLHSTLLSQVEIKSYKIGVIPFHFAQMQIQSAV